MIGYIEGEIVHTDERGIVVLTAGGIGYKVFLAEGGPRGPTLGDRIALWTHLAVREDALDLYGFVTRRDLGMFRALLSVSGIGPKSAATILASAGTDTLIHAIRGRDASYLVKTAGVGKKTAEKLVLELRDKPDILPASEDAGATVALGPEHEAIDALEALGYAARDVRDLVQRIAKEEREAEAIIRQALRELGKR